MKLLQERRIQDPSLTDANYYAARANRPNDPHIGRVWVTENAITRIGALAHIRRRLQHQEMTAERFKSDYEALFGSGVPALDNSRPVVDRSPVAHDSGMAAKIDRGASIRAVEKWMPKESFDKLIDLLILCTPLGEYARIMPSKQRNQRDVATLEQDRLGIINELSEFYGYSSKKGRAA